MEETTPTTQVTLNWVKAENALLQALIKKINAIVERFINDPSTLMNFNEREQIIRTQRGIKEICDRLKEGREKISALGDAGDISSILKAVDKYSTSPVYYYNPPESQQAIDRHISEKRLRPTPLTKSVTSPASIQRKQGRVGAFSQRVLRRLTVTNLIDSSAQASEAKSPKMSARMKILEGYVKQVLGGEVSFRIREKEQACIIEIFSKEHARTLSRTLEKKLLTAKGGYKPKKVSTGTLSLQKAYEIYVPPYDVDAIESLLRTCSGSSSPSSTSSTARTLSTISSASSARASGSSRFSEGAVDFFTPSGGASGEVLERGSLLLSQPPSSAASSGPGSPSLGTADDALSAVVPVETSSKTLKG